MRNLCCILSRRSSWVFDAPPQITQPYSSTDGTLPKYADKIGLAFRLPLWQPVCRDRIMMPMALFAIDTV